MLVTRRTAILGTAGTALAAATPLRFARAEDTIKIGGIVPLTGPAAETGVFMRDGAAMALDAINANGGVLGKKLEWVIEDDATTNPGAVLAFSRLVARGDCVAFTGSIRSTQVNAIAPDVSKAAKPVVFGGTDPTLTHAGNPWLFRTRPNDSYSARVMADFGINTLKKKRWAVVHSTDAFGTNGMKSLVDSLSKLGITQVQVQGYTNQQSDFTPVVLAVKQANPEILATYCTFENDIAIFARQLRQLGVQIPWIGSASITNTATLQLAGDALWGTYGVTDYDRKSSPEAAAYFDAYRKRFNLNPDNQSAWLYDGVMILALAINNAKSPDAQKIREAILAIRGYKGTEGVYNFDQNGDGLHGYNIVRNDKGTMVFDKRVDFND
jgi:branched-chain amino acid transport system substrate-binding protein